MKIGTIEHLKKLESLIWYEIPGEGPRSGYSPCDDIRFKDALTEAWPKLRAVFEAAEDACSEMGIRTTGNSKMDKLRDTVRELNEVTG